MKLKDTPWGGAPIVRDMPVLPSASWTAGAALIAGTTVSKSGLILATGALADFFGLLMEDVAVSGAGTVAAGTLQRAKVACAPYGLYEAEWSQSDIVSNDVNTATTSAVTMTTAQQDDFDGGYIYVVSGTGLGQLRYIGAATTTVFTVGTSMQFTTAVDGTSDLAFINSLNHQLVDVNSTALKLKASNASGASGRVCVLANYIKHDGLPFTELVPATHGTTDGINGQNPQFYCEFVFSNTFLHKID